MKIEKDFLDASNFLVESASGVHNMLQVCCKCVAVCCSILQYVAVRCIVLQCAEGFCKFVAETTPGVHSVLQVCCRCVAVCSSLCRFVVCCSALQRISVCCRVW